MGTIAKIKYGDTTHLIASTAYGTCDTAANTAAKVATIQDNAPFTLMTGVTIHIKFTYGNTVANPTLNVNSTGAKAIRRYGTTSVGSVAWASWYDGAMVSLTYDGTAWMLNDFYNTYQGIFVNCGTNADAAAKTASVTNFTLKTGSDIYLTFSNTNTATGTPTFNLNGTGAYEIRYKDGVAFKQGLAAGFIYHLVFDGTYWQLINQLALPYATCTVNSNQAKTVICDGFILYTGATIDILFTKDNTLGNTTLSINGTTAKPIIWMGFGNTKNNRGTVVDNISYRTLRANHIYRFVYDGTNYRIVDDTFRHMGTSGVTAVAAVTHTQEEYDQYVADNGEAPPWNVGDTKTAAVAAVTGSESLGLGNGIISNQNGGATGRLLLYGPEKPYHVLQSALTGNSEAARNMYIPNFAGDGYLVHTSDATALGSATEPVYVAANGRVTTTGKTLAYNVNAETTKATQWGVAYYSTTNKITSTAAGTSGYLLQGNGNSAAPSWIQATNANTASTIVKRDASGNFSAGTITATLSGTATNANYVNLYEARATTTTLNKAANYVGAGKMFHLIASSSTSATDNGKTPTDANVLQMNWDNNGGYDAQIAVSTSSNRMWFRDQPSAKKAWREVVTSTPGTAAGSDSEAVYISTTGVATKIETANLKAGKDGSGNTITSTYATKTEMNGIVAAADAMIFKGTLAGAATTTYTPAASCGDTYKVSTAGLINGERVEVGDILICTTDSTAAATSSNVSTVKANWAIVQNNVDGAVFKSTNTFTDGQVLVADGTTGKIKTSGYTIAKSVPSDAKFTDTVYTHPTTEGNKHIPSAGSSGQFLGWDSAGTAKWVANPNTDTKVNVTAAPTAITQDYILMTSTAPTSTATGNTALASSRMWVNAVDKGKFELVLGNATATSTSGGQFGQLALYSAGTKGTYLTAADNSSAWYTATLPAKTGTIALTSDIVDTKVNVVARGTTKAYLLADTTAPTSTAAAHTAVAETAVYLDTTAGKLVATSFVGNGSALTNLNGSNIASGTVPIARIPTGTSGTTVALGNHTHNYAGSSSAGGAATNVTTTQDDSSHLLLVGVKSDDTSTLRRTSKIAVQGQVLYPITNGDGSIGASISGEDHSFSIISVTDQFQVHAKQASRGYLVSDYNDSSHSKIVGFNVSQLSSGTTPGVGKLSLGNTKTAGENYNYTGLLEMYGANGDKVEMNYNSTTQSLDFIFA